jgi:ATP-dependent protease ClpP protease subunit
MTKKEQTKLSADLQSQTMVLPQQKSNIIVDEDKSREMAILKIYGEIDQPEEYIEEFIELEELSKIYNVVELTLNSPGGSTDTEAELLSILERFGFVITIARGTVASAAFTLWSRGDLRIVADHTLFMAHRESYSMHGKTREHVDIATVFNTVFEDMFDKYAHSLLTKDEIKLAERSDVWLTYKDMIERKACISYADYLKPKNAYTTQEFIVTKEGISMFFNPKTQTFMSATITFTDELEFSDTINYMYDIPFETSIDESNHPEESIKVKEPKEKKKKKNKIK